ncbi:fluoride efflux transporter CrcB [Novosphingobium sp. B 225]|uniref:fluoride efflux transporter CrcB n=1 Tax=Novosphingobium sp. B 225 TaxID=1961849 RepID=UPI000B4B92FB|nr:fluoride efflux transporter CrcB [Novosphingobium sp. B 225]
MSNPPTFMASSLFVALGGGIGAWLRYLASRLTIQTLGPVAASAFPWATLAVNLIGSMVMGLLAGWLARYGHGGEQWRLLLGVGVLGGFTTFSAFSLELVTMINRGATGTALLYALVSVAGGVVGLFLGLNLMRMVTA